MLHHYLFFTGSLLEAEPVALSSEVSLASAGHAEMSLAQSLTTSPELVGQVWGQVAIQQRLAGLMVGRTRLQARIEPPEQSLELCFSLHVWTRLEGAAVATGGLRASGVTVDARFTALTGTKPCL